MDSISTSYLGGRGVLGVVGDSYERGTEFKGYLARVILRGGADQSSHKVTFIMRWRPKRCAKSSGQPLGLPRPEFGFERQI
jgi:hypothetical protein